LTEVADNQTLSVSFTRTAKERYRDQIAARGRRLFVILAVYLALSLCILIGGILMRPGLFALAFTWLGLGLIHLVTTQIVTGRLSRRDQQRAEISSPPLPWTVKVTPLGLWSDTGYASGRASWTAVTTITDTQSLITFMRKGAGPIIVPRNAFSSDEYAEQFLRNARQYHAEGQNLPAPSLAETGAPAGITVQPNGQDIRQLHRWWTRTGGRTALIRERLLIIPFAIAALALAAYVAPLPDFSNQIWTDDLTWPIAVVVLLTVCIKEWRGDAMLTVLRSSPGAKVAFTAGLTPEGIAMATQFGISVYRWERIQRLDATGDAIHVLFPSNFVLRIPWRAFDAPGSAESFLAYAYAHWPGATGLPPGTPASATWPPGPR